LGLAEAAQNNPAYKEDKEGFMHVIYRNACRLDKLIKNILDVTRMKVVHYNLINNDLA